MLHVNTMGIIISKIVHMSHKLYIFFKKKNLSNNMREEHFIIIIIIKISYLLQINLYCNH